MTTSASNSWSAGAASAVSVAILYEQAEHRDNLVGAIEAAGAVLSGELKFSELSPGAVEALRANTLLLNLEPVLDRKPAILEQILGEQGARALIMNDAAASLNLTGTDRSRWQRHLAAKISANALSPLLPLAATEEPELIPEDTDDFDVWLLGASIGGPEAVRSFLTEIEPGCQAAMVLAQHIGADFVGTLAEQLEQVSPLPVLLAEPGLRLQPGRVIVAPVGRLMSFDRNGEVVLTDYDNPPHYSPCIDDVIAGLLERYGSRLNGIIFSGMASDGVAGAAAIRESGGQLWVQSPQSCVVSSMVEGALKDGPVQRSEAPAELARHLNDRLARKAALSPI
ncbi:MAG: chemotaxis protein CheB [Lysobacterales bacterium]